MAFAHVALLLLQEALDLVVCAKGVSWKRGVKTLRTGSILSVKELFAKGWGRVFRGGVFVLR